MRRSALICAVTAWAILFPGLVGGEGVKTHYKQYTIFTFQGEDYLCEPYQVKKDDWLYKIFRQKGEISASDFPKFLTIFKRLNPQVSNIDAIAPGNRVMIPLKRVDKDSYQQQEPGIVEMPVLEFSLKLGKKEVEDFIRPHVVQSGDTVSGLLGKEFLKKGGAVSDLGKQTFTRLNPEVADINRIYAGSHLLIPDPDILSQPWFETLLSQGLPDIARQLKTAPDSPWKGRDPARPHPVLSARDLSRLKRYAQLIQGSLMHEGKIFFPGKKGKPARILDLSKTPVLQEDSGQKTLVLPPDTPEAALDQDLVAAMKAYWKGLRLLEINKALSAKALSRTDGMNDSPRSMKDLVRTLISPTPFNYDPGGYFPVTLKNVEMTVSLGRIIHDTRPDLLVNTGSVYGQALSAIEDQGYEVLNLSPDMTFGEATLLVFAKLGYETWKNPSFYTGSRVETILGIYVSRAEEKYFFTRTPPMETALAFLENEGIQLLMIDEDAVQ